MPTINESHPPEFRTVAQLYRRMIEDDRSKQISVADPDVPAWQRQIVWTDDDQGLLALSILQNYPIGLIVLWKKANGVRVPIDGRQRLNAVCRFMNGEVVIPQTLSSVPAEYRGKKYKLAAGDDPSRQLSVDDRDRFDDYELTITQYDDIVESEAMDIFVRLQGGKSLTKTEIRAALGGQVCDFVTELTSGGNVQDEENEEVPEERSNHQFFRELAIRNSRKAHRNVCDILLHEYLSPGRDKHWSSLEALYRDKAATLSEKEKNGFRDSLSRFRRASLCYSQTYASL